MRNWVASRRNSMRRKHSMVAYQIAIDLKSSQLLASVKGCASRPKRRPTLDPVSALAESLVESQSEKRCSVQRQPDYSYYDWYSLGYVYRSAPRETYWMNYPYCQSQGALLRQWLLSQS